MVPITPSRFVGLLCGIAVNLLKFSPWGIPAGDVISFMFLNKIKLCKTGEVNAAQTLVWQLRGKAWDICRDRLEIGLPYENAQHLANNIPLHYTNTIQLRCYTIQMRKACSGQLYHKIEGIKNAQKVINQESFGGQDDIW